MLSRVADCLFWMSRYVERAEAVARLLDVGFHQELELDAVAPPGYRPPWRAALDILQANPPERLLADPNASAAVAGWLMFELDNPAGILACVNRGRNNARGIRGRLSGEVWRTLNALYWQLRDPEVIARAKESPSDYLHAVTAGSHHFQGVCDATLPHDEGWQFLQLGKHLERADKTIRLVDVKVRQLQSLTDPADLPLAGLEWAGVLKSSLAYEAYQRLFIGRVEPERVVEYLLLDAASPRSVRFSLEAAAAALSAIEGGGRGRADGPVEKLLGRILSDLRYADLPALLAGDFHGFLSALLGRCHQVSRAVQERYSLVA